MKGKNLSNVKKREGYFGLRLPLTCLFVNLLTCLHAQVSIGGLDAPVAGALLDLNKATKGALLLSNVNLPDLSKIPASGFVGITSEQETNPELSGMMVYNTNMTTGTGVYIWNGENWTPIGENCTPISSLTLTASDRIVYEGSNIHFSVSSGASNRCAEGERYLWQETGNSDNNFSDFTNTVYPASSISKTFSSPGTYKVRAVAANLYSSSSVTSDTAIVSIEPYAYYLTGKPCYDIYKTDAGRAARNAAARMATATNLTSFTSQPRTYRFFHDAAYSNLTLSLEGNTSIVTISSHPAANKNSNGVEPFDLQFNGTEGKVTLKANYVNKDGVPKQATMNIDVQDSLCGCPAKTGSSNSDWLVFQCHNLGGEDIFYSSQTIDLSHHGDWYRWGAKEPSVVNNSTTPSGVISDWDSGAYPAQFWGDWFVANDPCPGGWRLPTEVEWNAAMQNSSRKVWPDADWQDNEVTNFYQLGDYLFLPAAGYRFYNGFRLERGIYCFLWSSKENKNNLAGTWYAYFTSNNLSINAHTNNKKQALSVRCVAAE
jgi:uncharacterized protein (TIGR02145 family)